MYFALYTWTKRLSIMLSVFFLVSLAVPALKDFLQSSDGLVGSVLIALLSGCVLAQARLQDLAFAEAAAAVENVTYEELVARQEAQRRDKQ